MIDRGYQILCSRRRGRRSHRIKEDPVTLKRHTDWKHPELAKTADK